MLQANRMNDLVWSTLLNQPVEGNMAFLASQNLCGCNRVIRKLIKTSL